MCTPNGPRSAVPNRGQAAVAERIAQIEAALPFPILGFDTDNGGEFLNWHLVDYFGKRRVPIHFTPSRAYRKNDNARVEQKNWTHVRQLVGYGPLEGEQVAELLDELYRKEWSLFRNLFCPVMKHLRTESKGSCKRRIYDQPATPLARLKACPQANPVQIARLEQLMARLDPFGLKEKSSKSCARFCANKSAPHCTKPPRDRKPERGPEQTAAPPSSCL